MDRRVFLAVGLLALAACGGGSGGAQPTPVAPGPQQTTPPPAPRTAIVFVGDSITEGWWNLQLKTLLPASINAGISGQTSAQMRARFQVDVLDKNPATVVLLAGTNDILRTSDPKVDDIQAMADLASQAGARVIVGTVPPNVDWAPPNLINDPALGDAEIRRFNTDLRNVCAALGCQIADYNAALSLPDGSQNPALFRDGTHPNLAGYDVMWQLLQPLLPPT